MRADCRPGKDARETSDRARVQKPNPRVNTSLRPRRPDLRLPTVLSFIPTAVYVQILHNRLDQQASMRTCAETMRRRIRFPTLPTGRLTACGARRRRTCRALTLPIGPYPQSPRADGPVRQGRDAPVAPALYSRELKVISPRQDGGRRLLNHVARQTPGLMHDRASDGPALQNWSPERCSLRYGTKVVRGHGAAFEDPAANCVKGIATLSFDELLGLTPCGRQDLRLFPVNITRHTSELLGDVALPDRGLCRSRRFVHASFGCRGATAPRHDDSDRGRIRHTAVTGRRRARLSPVNPPQENANRVVRSGHTASPHTVAAE